LVDGLGSDGRAKEATGNTLGMGIGVHFNEFWAFLRHLMILGVAQETGSTVRLDGCKEVVKVLTIRHGWIREKFMDSTHRVCLTAKILGRFSHVVLTALLAGLEADGSEEVSHLKTVWERAIIGAEANLDGKPAVQPCTGSLTVGVVNENLDKIALIDELTTQKEHVTEVVQILKIVLERIGTALTGWCRIWGIMIEEGMSGECEDTP
jgi:hypothetical protein